MARWKGWKTIRVRASSSRQAIYKRYGAKTEIAGKTMKKISPKTFEVKIKPKKMYRK